MKVETSRSEVPSLLVDRISTAESESRKKLVEEFVQTKKLAQTTLTNIDVDDNDPDGRKSLVSGNGFGYAVLEPDGVLSKFYAHPDRFMRANDDVTKEGVPTFNFVQRLSWQLNGQDGT